MAAMLKTLVTLALLAGLARAVPSSPEAVATTTATSGIPSSSPIGEPGPTFISIVVPVSGTPAVSSSFVFVNGTYATATIAANVSSPTASGAPTTYTSIVSPISGNISIVAPGGSSVPTTTAANVSSTVTPTGNASAVGGLAANSAGTFVEAGVGRAAALLGVVVGAAVLL